MFAATDVDWVARGIAVGGLAIGVVSTWIAVLAFRRDRPEIKLTWHADVSVPELEVTVVNDGRQPIALASVLVRDWRRPLWVRLWPVLKRFSWMIRLRRGNLDYGDLSVDPLEPLEAPHVLQPGDPYVCTFEAARILRLADARRAVWLVAADVLGREKAERFPARLLELLRLSFRGR